MGLVLVLSFVLETASRLLDPATRAGATLRYQRESTPGAVPANSKKKAPPVLTACQQASTPDPIRLAPLAPEFLPPPPERMPEEWASAAEAPPPATNGAIRLPLKRGPPA